MAAQFTIGIDLGGTNIKGGLVDAAGTLLIQHSVATEAEHGVEHVVTRMAAVVDELIARAEITRANVLAVGVGAPGPMSHDEGVVYNAPNLPGWVNVPLKARMTAATGLPIVVENDANAAAYGEFIAGAGRPGNVHSLVMLTLGTGVGGGVIINDQLWRGADDSAGEIGHFIIVPGGRACPCGQLGCFERYAAASAVAGRFLEALAAGEESALRSQRAAAGAAAITSEEILRAADAGDGLAARMWDETCYYLAVGCINIERVLSPDMIVLAGGLTYAGERLLTPTLVHFRRLRWRLTRESMQIALADLGAEAGTIGAAALARVGVHR